MVIRKAQRQQAKLRIGITGPSGSGKTMSALLLAKGLGGVVGIADTERRSADKYADHKLLGGFPFDVIEINAPYEISKYMKAIKEFEANGEQVIILDSISHAWAGEGGLLDKQGKLEASGKFRNSFATWREITPEHNQFVDAMLHASAHLITTMRSKTEYVVETNDKGKQVPRKIGMAPIQREGLEYEMDIVFDLSPETNIATVSKDRTGLFHKQYFVISEDTGKQLAAWLNSGAEALPAPTKTEAMLDDEIPDFDKKPEAKAPQEAPLTDQAKTYAELIKGALFIGELDNEIMTHAPLMDRLGKELPAWRDRLLALIEQKRGEFVEAPPAPKAKRTKKAVIDDGGVKVLPVSDELNDPLPPMTVAEHLEQQLKESA